MSGNSQSLSTSTSEAVSDASPAAGDVPVPTLKAILVRARKIKCEDSNTLDQAWGRAATEAGHAGLAMPEAFRPSVPDINNGIAENPVLDVQNEPADEIGKTVAAYAAVLRASKYERAQHLGRLKALLPNETLAQLAARVGISIATAEEELLLFEYRPDQDARFNLYSPSAVARALRIAREGVKRGDRRVLDHAEKLLKRYKTVDELLAHVAGQKGNAGRSPRRRPSDTGNSVALKPTTVESLRAAVRERPSVASEVVRNLGDAAPKSRVEMIVTLVEVLTDEIGSMPSDEWSRLRKAIKALLAARKSSRRARAAADDPTEGDADLENEDRSFPAGERELSDVAAAMAEATGND